MRFKLDENLPVETVALLRKAGHDALTVVDQSMGGATDGSIVTVCRNEERILVTLDMDFADIRAYAPGDYRGLVVLRPWSHDRQHVLSLAERTLPAFEESSPEGKLWIVEEHRIRIRE